MVRIENMARHPQSPSVKFQKYLAAIRDAAIRSAEARATRDAADKRTTDYHRQAAGLPTKG
jgi:hypothetical protein